MTSYTWTGVSGDWDVAGDWTPSGGPPTTSDSATINGTASFSVAVDTADVANSLTLSDANATLNDDGASASLTIGETLTMSNGTLNISPDGDGGVLTVNELYLSGGALNIYSGGQLDAGFNLHQTGGTLTLDNGGSVTIGTAKGRGTDTISGDSTLEFLTGVSSPKTLGDQDIEFTGAGTLDLVVPRIFYGEISDFGSGDTVELRQSWMFTSISEASGMTTLTLHDGYADSTHAFEFVGDYTQSDFRIMSGATTKITYA